MQGGKVSSRGLGNGGKAMLASYLLPAAYPQSPGSLAACREEHRAVLSETGYFISHEMKNCRLSSRLGSVLFSVWFWLWKAGCWPVEIG